MSNVHYEINPFDDVIYPALARTSEMVTSNINNKDHDFSWGCLCLLNSFGRFANIFKENFSPTKHKVLESLLIETEVIRKEYFNEFSFPLIEHNVKSENVRDFVFGICKKYSSQKDSTLSLISRNYHELFCEIVAEVETFPKINIFVKRFYSLFYGVPKEIYSGYVCDINGFEEGILSYINEKPEEIITDKWIKENIENKLIKTKPRSQHLSQKPKQNIPLSKNDKKILNELLENSKDALDIL